MSKMFSQSINEVIANRKTGLVLNSQDDKLNCTGKKMAGLNE